MTVAPTLAVAGLRLDLGRTPILRGVGIDVMPGEVHGLVGESGAGKTIVGKAVLGIAPAGARIRDGRMTFLREDLIAMPERRRRDLLGRQIALIPQDPMTGLNPVLRIDRQMTDPLRLHLGLDRAAALAKALELLHQVHIREPERVLRQYPHELSGGMRQRVLIAMAFSCRPQLIVADEPTTALDVTVQRQILRLIKELQETAGTAILFITHDLGVVSKICDRVSVIHSGRILESAGVADLFDFPQHDYTRALMRATPRYDRPGDVLEPVPADLTARLIAEAEALDA